MQELKNVSPEDQVVLEGLKLEGSYRLTRSKLPKDLHISKHNAWISENMGEKQYKLYTEASKKFNYLMRRQEEMEGMKQLQSNNFKDYRAYAYPVHNKIVREIDGSFGIKPVVDFKSRDSIFLTHSGGYNTPKHQFQEALIQQLQEDLKTGALGDTIELGNASGYLYFRIVIEKYNK